MANLDDSQNNSTQPALFDHRPDTSADTRVPAAINDASRDHVLLSILALRTVKGIGFKTLCSMFDAGLLQDIWNENIDEISDRLAPILGRNRVEIVKTVHDNKEDLLKNGNESVASLRDNDVVFIPQGHKDYPQALLRLSVPPKWIFAKGTLEVLHSDSIIAVVGTRTPSKAGMNLARQCAGELAKRNIVVLSGMAKGIDENAHDGATKYYGQSIAVLGHGILASDTATNSLIQRRILSYDGAIVSEYLPLDPPSRENFLRRNELQVALSKVVIPIECPSMESGTGATIRRAMNIGTPVIGVLRENEIEQTLRATEANLRKLNFPVFTVMSQTPGEKNSTEFWNHLKKLLPHHNWEVDPTARQDRFFDTIERLILNAKTTCELDDKAVDRLAERLKLALHGHPQ